MKRNRPSEPGLSRRGFLALGASAPVLWDATASCQPAPLPNELRPEELQLEITVNGTKHTLLVRPEQSLLEVLRDTLNLPSARRGCENGSCGVCTQLLDGQRVPACLVPAPCAHQKQVTTAEGLLQNGELGPLQHAFLQLDAVDCGYCTPGQLVAGQAILTERWGDDPEELRRALCGHRCACGKQPQIVAALGQVKRTNKSVGDKAAKVGDKPTRP